MKKFLNMTQRSLLLLGSFLLIGQGFAAPIKVKAGLYFPMTGNTAAFGQDMMNGIKLALEDVKKKGEVEFETVLEDDQGDPTGAANAVRKLINVDKVQVVIGSVPSSNTNAAAPIAQAAKIPLLTPASTNVNVTTKGDYISRICFIDDFQGLAMAKFAAETLKMKTAAVITDSSSDYSLGLAKAFKDAFTKMGGKIVSEVSYVAKDQDFSSQLTKIKGKKPEVVFLPGYYTDVANLLRQAKNFGVRAPFLGGDGWSADELFSIGGEAVVGNFFSDHFAQDDTDPKVKEFVTKFQAAYKKAPNAMSALGYDAILVIADAVKRAGKTDGKSLMAAINSTKGFVGVTGAITLDKNRNATKPLVILETLKDRPKFKQRVAP
jgi:branched-chain amino acid transport system substrate-binding protein